MKTCPNCSKRLNESFTYCNECGSRLDGEITGDFKTGHLNVFRQGEEFVYLFAVRGRQVVLKADSLVELERLVRIEKFPWKEPERGLLNHEASLTQSANDDYGIISVATLERNPDYSNLDKLFK